MLKRYTGLIVVAAASAACSNEATAPRMATPESAAFTSSVSSPNTPVGAQFVIHVGGSTYYAGSGPSLNGKGECRTHDDGTTGWYWVPGNAHTPGNGKNGAASGDQENGPNHAQCLRINGGYTVTVTFSDTATYVKPTSGNYALNFNPVCVPNADPTLAPTCYSRDVHYNTHKDSTQGEGVLHGVGVRSDNGAVSHWSIDLSQIASSSNLIDDPPRTLYVTAHNDEGLYPESPATITW